MNNHPPLDWLAPVRTEKEERTDGSFVAPPIAAPQGSAGTFVMTGASLVLVKVNVRSV